MKRAEDFKRALGPMDAGFDSALRQTLAALQTTEEFKMKRKASAGLVLAAAVVLITVTAMAGAFLPGVLDMLFGSNAPDVPESMVRQLTGQTAETPHARVCVREMIYDGLGAYVVLDIAPASPMDLLLPITLEYDIAPNRPASCLGLTDVLPGETVADYAARSGQTMVYTSLYLDDQTTLGLSVPTKEDLHSNGDGSWTIVQRLVTGAALQPSLRLSCYTTPFTHGPGYEYGGKWMRGWEPVYAEDNSPAILELPMVEICPPTDVRSMAACEEAAPLHGILLNNVTVTRTPVAVYLDVACELTIEGETGVSPLVFTDASLYAPLRQYFVRSLQSYTEGSVLHTKQCFSINVDIPDDLWIDLFAGRPDSQIARHAGTVHVTLK